MRKLAVEAADNGLLAPELAAGITRVKGAKSKGVHLGDWLSLRQAQALLNAPDTTTKKGLRDRAMLAILLGCGLRRSEVAGSATLLRWLKDPDFDTAYREARRAALRQSVARLQQASGAAVTTLLKLMVDPATPPSTKARAADSALDHSAKAVEIEDIEARVAELERAAEASRQGRLR